MSNKAVQQPLASGKFPTSKLSPDKIASQTRAVAGVMQKNAGYAGSNEMQENVTAWLAAGDAVGSTMAQITAIRLTLAALLVTLWKQIPVWRLATAAVVGSVNKLSAGSKAAIVAWGLELVTHTKLDVSTDPPGNLRAVYRKNQLPLFRWGGVAGHVGYFLQLGDGTPQGWGAPIACPKALCAPPGLVLGQKVAARVAVQRRSGMSTWSEELVITVH